ncbi:hypothetical protein [Vibrio vulnificus]|uniref:Uncharacterized protein n=1 Tax=Vibrio vulnificus TaxID=672 RepID=A0AAN1PL56_VIBVL|nr:hypothetical protein [Vibrio vulnificus]AXX58814.1 hypothetical protein FORC53_0475 [Vibrio vulnificus]
MKKLFIISSLVSILSIAFVYRFNAVDRSGLVLPTCTLERVIETKIDFYVTDDVSDNVSMMNLQERISKYINKANLILSNSCIPIKRSLGKLETIDTSTIKLEELESTKYQPLRFASVAQEILKKIGKDNLIQYYSNKPMHYFVLVYGEKFKVHGSSIIGSVDPNISNSMVVLDYYSSNHHLEHELGHLAGALHKNSDRTIALRNFYLNSDEKGDIIKPYSGGFACSGHSTVMYNGGASKYPNMVLDVYSSPDIKFNGKPCGDKEKANNQKVMVEYSKN